MKQVETPADWHQVFNPEEFVAVIRGADLEACQLSQHPCRSRIMRMAGSRICLDYAEIGPAMLFTGVMPRDCYTLVFVTKCPETGHSFNFATDHRDGYMGFFPPGGQLDAYTPEGYANAMLTVPAPVFHSMLDRYFPEIPDGLLKRGAGMRIGRQEEIRLRLLLAAIADPTGSFAGMAARDDLEFMLIETFFGALRSGAEYLVPRPKRPFAGRLRHLRQAREFIESASHGPIHVEDVCKAVGMSQRGVEALFHDSLGIGPNAFIRHQRLHGVRRALLESRPGIGIVKELALDWGFWHMGHFSENYRSLFGECPSATLTRSAG